jgi:hypothetical protein
MCGNGYAFPPSSAKFSEAAPHFWKKEAQPQDFLKYENGEA